MASLQDLQSTGREITKQTVKNVRGTEFNTYMLALPEGTTPQQADALINDGLTENNKITNGNIKAVTGQDGKIYIAVPENQIQYIDKQELALFKQGLAEQTNARASAAAENAPPAIPPTEVPPAQQPPAIPPTEVPPAQQQPAVPPTEVPPAQQPPAIPPTEVPPAQQQPAVPPTEVPPAQQQPAVPPTEVPPAPQPAASAQQPTTAQTVDDEDQKNKKSKLDTVRDMLKDGNFIGAILAMIFLPEDKAVEKSMEQKLVDASKDMQAAVMKHVDTNGDKTISKEEALALANKPDSIKALASELARIAKEHKLDPAAIEKMAAQFKIPAPSAAPVEPAPDAAKVQAAVKELDKSGEAILPSGGTVRVSAPDGRIDPEAKPNLGKIFDLDGNGKVSEAEYKAVRNAMSDELRTDFDAIMKSSSVKLDWVPGGSKQGDEKGETSAPGTGGAKPLASDGQIR